MNKHLGMLLGSSILLNAFFGGFLVSKHMSPAALPFDMRKAPEDGGPPNHEDMMLRHFQEKAENLSPDGKKKILDIINENKGSFPPKNGDTKDKILSEIHDALIADNFDAGKLMELHKKLNTDGHSFMEKMGDIIIKIATTLSKEDRQIFFKDIGPGHDRDEKMDENHDGPPHDEF